MLPIFNGLHNKARFSGLRVLPAKALSLYQKSLKVFVAELNQKNKNAQRVPELHSLPSVALVSIFEEISQYPSLRTVLRQELSDPVLFMRVFNGHDAYQSTLKHCLREASLSGKPVLPALAENYCELMRSDLLEVGSQSFVNRISSALKLGSYLYDAGCDTSSVKLLLIVKDMILQIRDNQFHAKLELDCAQLLLQAQASCGLEGANQTCETLLALIENVTDTDVLVKSYLHVANHHLQQKNYDECHEWTLKAMNLITDDSPIDAIIKVLQLEAQFCCSKQRFDIGNMLICQAIQRTREHFGTRHHRYADVLRSYGECLLQMNAISEVVSTFTELLHVTIQLHGVFSPHLASIQGQLAYGLYLLSQKTDRFDLAMKHVDEGIKLAKQVIPEQRQVMSHLIDIRRLVQSGRNETLANAKMIKPIKVDSYQRFTFVEIREKHLELDAAFACCENQKIILG